MTRYVALGAIAFALLCGCSKVDDQQRVEAVAAVRKNVAEATIFTQKREFDAAKYLLRSAAEDVERSKHIDVSTHDALLREITLAQIEVGRLEEDYRSKLRSGWRDFEGQFRCPEEIQGILDARRAEEERRIAEQRAQEEYQRLQREEAERRRQEAAEQKQREAAEKARYAEEYDKAVKESKANRRREAEIAAVHLIISYDRFKDKTYFSTPEYTFWSYGSHWATRWGSLYSGRKLTNENMPLGFVFSMTRTCRNQTPELWKGFLDKRRLVFLLDGSTRISCLPIGGDWNVLQDSEDVDFLLNFEELVSIISAKQVEIAFGRFEIPFEPTGPKYMFDYCYPQE